MLIGGEWVAPPTVSGATCSPGRRGTILARVPVGRPADADRAVAAARAAFPGWRALHFKERQKALLDRGRARGARRGTRRADRGRHRQRAADPGRPESQTLVNLFRYFGGVAGEFKGTVLPAGDDQLQYTRREPLGVVAGILPWNSPLMIAGMKTPAALAAGNTLVLKTAEDAPLTVLRLAEIAARVPAAGVLNVVTGEGRWSARRCSCTPASTRCRSPDPPRSAGTSREVAGKRLAHVSLELGGKSPNIVFPDAAAPDSIDATAAGVLLAMRFTRQGQSCTAGSRLFVHADVYDDVPGRAGGEGLGAAWSATRWTRPPTWARSSTPSSIESVLGYIEDGKSQPGVEVALDGTALSCRGARRLLPRARPSSAAVDNTWRIAQEEIFGPVLVAIPWRDRDEVIAMANDSHYGLAAYIWTQRPDRRAGHRAPGRVRLGAGQPGRRPGRRPVLRRLQGQRHRPRVLHRGRDRGVHPDQADQRADRLTRPGYCDPQSLPLAKIVGGPIIGLPGNRLLQSN